MSGLTYTSINTVLAKVNRELRGTDINETDVIEWIGESLDFMKVNGSQEEALAFIEVKDYHAIIPDGFQMVLQIAKHNNWVKQDKDKCSIKNTVDCLCNEPLPVVDECGCKHKQPVITDCQGKIIGDYDIAYYRPFFDLAWEFYPWTMSRTYRNDYTPVRLANHTLFNSLVCKEKDQSIYTGNEDEYTIVGTEEKKLRFSFKEGYIALAYLRSAIDAETGYPLIPDNISCITAATYYVKWKIAEWYAWNGREGYSKLAADSMTLWNKYAKQTTNYIKMPKTLDDYQDLLEQSHYLVPRHKKYYHFFGKLKRYE